MITTTRWLLIVSTVALLWALGVRLPIGDTAAALLAMVVAVSFGETYGGTDG